MASKWLYLSDGKTFGPVSSSELKQLANAGELAPSDLVWQEGREKRVPASQVKGLMPKQAVVPPPVPQQSLPPSPPPQHQTKPTFRDRANALKDDARAAGQIAAMEAEKAKITQVSLPTAQRALGKNLYTAKRFQSEFPESYANLDQLAEQISLLEVAKPNQEAGSFTDKAKALANQTKDAAKKKLLAGKLAIAERDLGKAAYERFGDETGDTESIKTIRGLHTRLDELERSVDAIGTSTRLVSPKRLLIGACCVLAICVSGLVWFSSGREKSPLILPSVVRSNEDLPSNRKISQGSQRGQDSFSGLGSEQSQRLDRPRPKFDPRIETIYSPPALEDFSELDFTKGPNGEPLKTTSWKNQHDWIVYEQGFVTTNGKEMVHGVVRIKTAPDGMVVMEQHCYDNAFHGPYREWHYQNGQLATNGAYVRGRKHGRWQRWNIDGTPAVIETWSNGKKNGKGINFYKSGLVECELGYLNDVRHGPVRRWNKRGQAIVETTYNHGVPRPTFSVEQNTKAAFKRKILEIFSDGGGVANPFSAVGNQVLWQETFNAGSNLHDDIWEYSCADGSVVLRQQVTPGSDIAAELLIVSEL